MEVEDEAEFISSIINEISYVKGERLDLKYYYSQNCPEEWFKKLYDGYDEMLKTTGKIDFDDMLVMCHELFTERKDILAAWQKKFKYILVDEFQDINLLQYQVVRMLALPENNLFIVGDDDQSIYRFRGAKPEIMLGFEKDFPGTKRVLLGTNYRSTKEIVRPLFALLSTIRSGLRRSWSRSGDPDVRWISGFSIIPDMRWTRWRRVSARTMMPGISGARSRYCSEQGQIPA